MPGDAPPSGPVPRATYRLQLGATTGDGRTLDFDAAAAQVPRLAALGISHLYLSPCLQALPGSPHGYDVTDPGAVDTGRGGEEALARLLAAARTHGLGVLLDIVPNHMAAHEDGPWWRDVLARGRESPHARCFDIDWSPSRPELRDRVLLPILGAPLAEEIRRGHVRVVEEEGTRRLAVYDRRLPLAEGTSAGGDLHQVLAVQHYLLEHWRTGVPRLNWRRFFDVDTLVGLRVEDEEVFRRTHERVLGWTGRGAVHGLRIDHPDGLRDPAGYTARLRAAAPGAWIVVEKILEPGETLPPDWPVHGTTGYEFMAAVTGLFVDPAGEAAFTALEREVTGADGDVGRLVHRCREEVLHGLFPGERERLAGDLAASVRRSPPAPDRAALAAALDAALLALPVYRTYLRPPSPPGPHDRGVLHGVLTSLRARPDLHPGAVDAIAGMFRGEPPDRAPEWVARFQQLSGPLMAKGVEDTALYRHRRLLCLNEVGSDPGRFGTSPAQFHDLAARHPFGLLPATTHDTKRSQDVRLRIAALSEVPGRWREAVARIRAAAPTPPDPGLGYYALQTLVGCWPLEDGARLGNHLLKAAREAKEHTSWIDGDAEYEAELMAWSRAWLADRTLIDTMNGLRDLLLPAARRHGLAATLLALTAPGVPDVYQGAETWHERLTDPDNRGAPDFAHLARLQEAASSRAGTPPDPEEPAARPFLLQRVLDLRRHLPRSFTTGEYRPLEVLGPHGHRVLAFARDGRLVTVVPRLLLGRQGGWGGTAVTLPPGRWRQALSGRTVDGGRQRVGDLLAAFPVAFLVRE